MNTHPIFADVLNQFRGIAPKVESQADRRESDLREARARIARLEAQCRLLPDVLKRNYEITEEIRPASAWEPADHCTVFADPEIVLEAVNELLDWHAAELEEAVIARQRKAWAKQRAEAQIARGGY